MKFMLILKIGYWDQNIDPVNQKYQYVAI